MAQYSPFTATGDGTTTAYTFAFEYIDTADVKARVNNVLVTNFTVSGSTLTFTTAPPNGQSVKIFRDTDNQTIQADFQSGSALRAVDLNDNFTQLLFVTQESTDVADTATADAANAVVVSNNAVTTANTANTNSTNAVNTANTASTNATAAVNTANTASTNASAAVTTANSAASDATSAVSTANTASTTANTASTTANTASTNASTALSTANTASTDASAAVTTANAASATATAAQNAVAAVLVYDPIVNVAGIPSSPSDGDRIEIANSTGIESFTPLAGLPSGFVGSSQLSVRLNYTSSGSTWNWTDYSAQDPDARYFLKSSGDTNTTNIATNTTNISTNTTNIATKMPSAGGTFTGAVNFDDNVVIKGDSTNGSGKITLNCEVNTHGVHIKGPPHSAGATYTLTLPNNTGTNGQALLTDGSGVMSWGDVTTDLSGVLALTGGTMTGAITLSGAPTASLHAASKQYVDDNKVIAIDAGNFDNGSSTISSTLTIDGGSF
jgi:hypothetical protein